MKYAVMALLLVSAWSPTFAQNLENLTANHTNDRIVTYGGGSPETGLLIADGDGQNARPLLPQTSHDYNPTLSNDGKWVVFTSERTGFAQIYRVHPDGSHLEQLTKGTNFDDQGALSPNGRTLVFVSSRADGGMANIWLLDLKSGTYRDLTQSHSGNFRPNWSPDGQWIAFTSDRDTPHRRRSGGWELEPFLAIYIIHPDGSGLHRLTATDAYAASPKWSLDGRYIAFSDAEDGFYPSQPMRIASIDVKTGIKKPLSHGSDLLALSPQYVGPTEIIYAASTQYGVSSVTTTSGRQGPPAAIWDPSWSRDGKVIVYDTRYPSNSKPGNLIPYADPHTKLRLYGNGMGNSAYTSDGQQIAFFQNEGALHAISVMDSDGTHHRTLFAPAAQQAPVGDTISWSPDGKLIAFGMGRLSTRDPVLPTQLALIRSDGSGLRMLIDDKNSNAYPSFSPDGQRIVFRVLGSEQGLRIISLADGKVTKLTGDWDDFPSWSPHGDLILFTSFRTGDYEVYTIRPDGTDLRQLTNDHGNNAHPLWSPDGNMILFSSSRVGYRDEAMRAHGPQAYGKLFLMHADGTGLTLLTDNQWEDAATAWLPPAP